MKKTPLLPMFLLSLVSVFWALAYLVMKDAHPYISTNSLIIIRSGIAAFLVFVFLVIKKGRVFLRNLKNKNSIKFGFFLGCFAAMVEMLQSYCAEYTTENNSAFIAASSIVLVPFLSYFLYKTPLTQKTIFSVIIVMFGVACLTIFIPSNEVAPNMLKGNLLALTCAFVLAFDITLIRRFIRSADQFSLYFYQFFFGMLIGGVCGWLGLFGGFYIDESRLVFDSFEGMKDLIFPVLYLSVFSTMYAYIVMDWAQFYVTPTTEAIFSAMEPIFTLFFMWLIRSQIPDSVELVGLVITFFGILFYLLDFEELKRRFFGVSPLLR